AAAESASGEFGSAGSGRGGGGDEGVQSRRGHPESAEQIMGLEHAGPDRVAIAGADVVDGGIGEFGQPVDGPADEHRIGVAAGPHPSDRLGGGAVLAGVGEDKDEAPSD